MLSEKIRRKSRATRAFTLVELLVIITIISILVMMLVPSGKNMIAVGHRVKCGASQRNLHVGWWGYTTENNGRLVESNTRNSNCWVLGGGGSEETRINNIRNGALWQYVGSLEVYSCTTPQDCLMQTYKRHFSISGMFNGERRRWTNISQVPEVQATVLMVEEYDPRNYLMNSYMFQTRGKNYWTDYLAGNHMNGDNFMFADGHLEYRRYKDPDTLTVYNPWRGHWQPDPDGVNADMDWLGPRYRDPRWRSWYPNFWRE
jgi:Tfp pilus assembly protein PilE